MKQHTHLIDTIATLCQKAQITPTQYRYVTRKVRQRLNLVTPKASKALPDYLSPSEVYQLLEISKHETRENILLEFLVMTGLRISEARNLLIEHIDFTNHVLKVVQGKGSKDRYVPITTNLQTKLLLLFDGRRKGYVFTKLNQRPYAVRSLQHIVTKWLDKLHLPKQLSTHSLRHTFACMCMARGLSIYQVKDLLGHSNVKTTEIYAKLSIEHIKNDFLRLMDVKN